MKAVTMQSAKSLQSHEPWTLSAAAIWGEVGKEETSSKLGFPPLPRPREWSWHGSGLKLYTSGYMFSMRGSWLCSFADSISWSIVLFSAFSNLLICLVLWHFFHIFGTCLLLKQTQIWPEVNRKTILCFDHCIQKSVNYILHCNPSLHPEILQSLSLLYICINVKERHVKEIYVKQKCSV